MSYIRDGKGIPSDISKMVSLKVGNLSYETSERDLRSVFGKFGDIGDIFIPRDHIKKRNRGFAFVRFYHQRDAEDAIREMDQRKYDGRLISVNIAKYGPPNYNDQKKPHKRSRSRSYSRERRRRSRSSSYRFKKDERGHRNYHAPSSFSNNHSNGATMRDVMAPPAYRGTVNDYNTNTPLIMNDFMYRSNIQRSPIPDLAALADLSTAAATIMARRAEVLNQVGGIGMNGSSLNGLYSAAHDPYLQNYGSQRGPVAYNDRRRRDDSRDRRRNGDYASSFGGRNRRY